MKTALTVACVLVLGITSCKDETSTGPVQSDYDAASAVRGGILYDKFWATEATYDLSDTAKVNRLNTYADFFRCKQCHAWDLLGNTGSYINRGPRTNRPRVSASLIPSKAKTAQQLFDAIKTGSATRRSLTADLSAYNPTTNSTVGDQMPNFSTLLSDAQIWDVVKFIKEGALDVTLLYDGTYTGTYPTGTAQYSNIGKDGNAANGRAFYATNCATCHGTDGKFIPNLDGPAGMTAGKFVRTTPNEAQHKIKFGQLGTGMTALSAATPTAVKDLYKALADTLAFPN